MGGTKLHVRMDNEHVFHIAQSAGVVEYTDCLSAEG